MSQQASIPQPPPKRPASGALDPSAPRDLAPDLPPFANSANDLETIKKAVDDAAAVGGGLWLSYLGFLFYLAIAAGAVTHEDLFFEKAVKLPFLNVDLPLLAFFFIAPILFLVVHAYTLVNLVFLTEKAKWFDKALRKRIRKSHSYGTAESPELIRENLRRQLPSSIFIQFLVGPRDFRRGLFGWLLLAIAWITLVIAPILLLLLLQLQFLPYHSYFITWTQRLTLLADLGLIWWLWGKVLSGREVYPRRRAAHRAWLAASLVSSTGIVLFSWTLATFPGEWQEENLPNFLDWALDGSKVPLHDWIFNSEVNRAASRRWLLVSSTLVLTDLNVYESLGIDDPEKLKSREYVFRAHHRDLKGAVFSFAILQKVDFRWADLWDAKLDEAQLQDASFEDAQLQGAKLDGAHLQGALLRDAQLQGASLESTQLQGAKLDGAQIQGASLAGAKLQGASLAGVRLQGAKLDGANLQGASLDNAKLQGASLQEAELRAADLSNAYLWRARLGSRAHVPLARHVNADNSQEGGWYDSLGGAQKSSDAYIQLRNISDSLPHVGRDRFLTNIRNLDPSYPNPTEAAGIQMLLQGDRVSDLDYGNALAAELKRLVCSGEEDAIYVVRGSGLEDRLGQAGAAAVDLVNFFKSKACPVSASLTDNDKARLLRIGQRLGQQAPEQADFRSGL